LGFGDPSADTRLPGWHTIQAAPQPERVLLYSIAGRCIAHARVGWTDGKAWRRIRASAFPKNKIMAEADYRSIMQWLVAQIQAGHDAPTLLQSMRERGWSHEIAMELIAKAMGERAGAPSVATSPVAQSEASSARPADAAQTLSIVARASSMPQPMLEDGRLYLDAGDRKVSVLMQLPEPQIVLFGDFLSKDECDRLVETSRPRMQRSLTADRHTGADQVDQVRTSRGMFFGRGENPLVRTIETRIEHLLQWPIDRGEDLQVLHYKPGDRYEPHYDYFDPDGAGAPALLSRGGQRIATLLMYLREPERGGETTFPDLGLRFAAKRGCALFFSYDRPHPSTKTLHGGAPVIAGEKWVATKWLREGVFE
jgi:prolyl 4-hydroxylase